MAVAMHEVCEGLWLWRQPHPSWTDEADWGPEVSSYAVRSRGVRWLIDPLAPPPSERAAWERIEAHGADAVAVLKPDHVRDLDLFVRWYGAEAHGPQLFWPGDVPRTVPEPIRPGRELPGGLRALEFEHVLVSHGAPVHDRAAFEAALER